MLVVPLFVGGYSYEIIDAVEKDKYAIKSFNAIHGTNFEPQDITQWDKNIDIDLIMHGSPCQDYSLAGKQAGGDKGSGTRSSLMYESVRIIENLKPKYVIWENVKNLLSKKHRHNFEAYLTTMESLGYNNYYQVLNAKDYNVPQRRERIFTVSIRKDIDNKTFVFPEKEDLKIKLKDLLEDKVDEKYYLSDKAIQGRLNTNYQKYKLEENIINDKEIHPTILARFEGAPTLVEDMNSIVNLTQKRRIRKLTPKECWRIMSFSDYDFEKARSIGMSDSQLYKQAGNSIVVDVLLKIFKNLL